MKAAKNPKESKAINDPIVLNEIGFKSFNSHFDDVFFHLSLMRFNTPTCLSFLQAYLKKGSKATNRRKYNEYVIDINQCKKAQECLKL